MSEDKNPESGSGEKSGSRKSKKRRYFRRKRRKPKTEGNEPAKSTSTGDRAPAKQEKSGTSKQRTGRRGKRRRRRSRSKRNADVAAALAHSGPKDLELDYVPPESVFVYTHIARAETRDNAYEYRSEHFSGVSRRIEDFQIDLSPLLDRAPRPPVDYGDMDEWDEMADDE